MNHAADYYAKRLQGVPRVCGDEPIVANAITADKMCSPSLWG